MPAKKHNLEGIIGELREVEVMLGQGGTIAEACRRISVSEQTYYRWRKESPWANGYNERFITRCATANSSTASPRPGC
jgi:transposase-like protein